MLGMRGSEALAAYRYGTSFPTARPVKTGLETYADDPEFPGPTPSEVSRLREEAAQARRERVRYEELVRKEAKESRELALLLAERHRQVVAELSADISDTRKAIVSAHERAVVVEAAAVEALRSAQLNSVVLGDGRRLYFTADGAKLYSEQKGEILDAGVIAEATERHFSSATTYEELANFQTVRQRAAETSRRLQDTLVQLDGIESKLAGERLNSDELKILRHDMDQVLTGLPADAREEYDRLRDGRAGERAPAYMSSDPAFESASLLTSAFRKAVSPTEQPQAEVTISDKQRAPVYRAAPPF